MFPDFPSFFVLCFFFIVVLFCFLLSSLNNVGCNIEKSGIQSATTMAYRIQCMLITVFIHTHTKFVSIFDVIHFFLFQPDYKSSNQFVSLVVFFLVVFIRMTNVTFLAQNEKNQNTRMNLPEIAEQQCH